MQTARQNHQLIHCSSWQSLRQPSYNVPCVAATRASDTLVRNKKPPDTQSIAKQRVCRSRQRKGRAQSLLRTPARQHETPSSLTLCYSTNPQRPSYTHPCASPSHALGMTVRSSKRSCTESRPELLVRHRRRREVVAFVNNGIERVEKEEEKRGKGEKKERREKGGRKGERAFSTFNRTSRLVCC